MTTTLTAPSRRRRAGRGSAADPWREFGMLVVFVGIAFAVAALGTITTITSVDGWYAHSPHVPWTPPNWTFGVVWTVLYAMIGVSGWLVWRQRRSRIVGPALAAYVLQLVLNSLWAPVFFGGFAFLGLSALWIGLAIILLLDLAVTATIAGFWPLSRPAALLLVPYLGWILFASTLNWGDAALYTIL
ncbi:TspO/MBR family protein [uncultured Amnibacterium sp.]|uniref:TspO/MBR family protein n=1 Tax=uncultured Amnibacterium sp. TaxID=1631851 RepID=UPI0035CB4E18